MKRRAFTLVELLVVIAIIGLLSTVAVVALSSSRTKARNARRLADTRQLVKALNMGLDDNGGEYPRSTTDNWYCLSTACTGEWAGVLADPVVVDPYMAPYIPVKPNDPQDGVRTLGGYPYNGNWAGGGGFTRGAYIEYAYETNSGVCPWGGLWANRGAFVQCMIKLDE